MGVSPWPLGQLAPLLATFATDSSILDVTTATFALFLRERSSGIVTTGAGSWVVTDGSNGVATYSWAAQDVATAGTFDIRAVATIAGIPFKSDYVPFLIEP